MKHSFTVSLLLVGSFFYMAVQHTLVQTFLAILKRDLLKSQQRKWLRGVQFVKARQILALVSRMGK